MMVECENCPIRQLCDEVDDCYDEGHVDYKLLEKIYMKGKEDGIKEFYNRLLVNKKDINLANNPWNYIELVTREMSDGIKEGDNK